MLDVAWYLHQHNREPAIHLPDTLGEPAIAAEYSDIVGQSPGLGGSVEKPPDRRTIGHIGADTWRKWHWEGIDSWGHPPNFPPKG